MVRWNEPPSAPTLVMSMRPVPVLVRVSVIATGVASTSTPPKSTVIPGDSDTAGPTLV